MLLKEKSEEFKQFFLLAFTRELIKNAIPEEFLRLEIEEKIQKESIKEKTKRIIKASKKPLKLSSLEQIEAMTQPGFKPLPKSLGSGAPRRLMIPKQNFPTRLQYIKPVPSEVKIDLGKLNPLIQDPQIQSIECNGPDENIIIKTNVERKIDIVLTKEEIEEVINKFAEAAKIPKNEGVFRVAVGKLMLSSIISEVIGSKFVITKIRTSSTLMPRY